MMLNFRRYGSRGVRGRRYFLVTAKTSLFLFECSTCLFFPGIRQMVEVPDRSRLYWPINVQGIISFVQAFVVVTRLDPDQGLCDGVRGRRGLLSHPVSHLVGGQREQRAFVHTLAGADHPQERAGHQEPGRAAVRQGGHLTQHAGSVAETGQSQTSANRQTSVFLTPTAKLKSKELT